MGRTIQLYGFSCIEDPEEVKCFLEQCSGEGTVCDVKFADYMKLRAHAKVEFIDSESAEIIKSLADERLLWYGCSYLKARDLRAETLEDVTLHFVCQVSKDKFSVFWKKEDVSVKFGEGLRTLYFHLSYDSVDYKLELSYKNIWQIVLHQPIGRASKFLLLQLLGAPRIFRKQASGSCWERSIDFTPSRAIGQSSALCLEIPSRTQLPNLRDGFVFYKEDEGLFSLQNGSSFSSSSDLVPMVVPRSRINLPYKILFKINSLVQHGCLPAKALTHWFFQLVDPTRVKLEYIECALEKLFHLKDCCYDPLIWLSKQYMKYKISRQTPEVPTIALDEGLVYVHRVQITPTKVYFGGPEINLSNRVLRNYPNDIENFLRVSFVDEDLDKLFSTALAPHSSSAEEKRRTRLYDRILSILSDGIVIGDKKFEFLAFSPSQLREGSAWMFASRDGLTAEDIRKWMGDFRQIKNVAKYAARLGQSFSSSRETLRVGVREVQRIPDIEVERDGNKYCFSDGIGKISEEFAKQVAEKCGLNRFTPSAFQIRYAGYKGVVAVDPTSSMKLSLERACASTRPITGS